MNTERVNPRLEAIDEVSKWSVGFGIVTVALFPIAIPILLLTAVALLPLLLPVLALGLLAAPFLLVRRLTRRLGGRRRSRKRSGPLEGDRSLRVGTVNAERAG